MPPYSLTKHKDKGKFFLNGRSYQYNWKEEPKRFNLMCVVRLLFKIAIEKLGITALKSSVRATEKYAYCPGYLHLPQDMAFQS